MFIGTYLYVFRSILKKKNNKIIINKIMHWRVRFCTNKKIIIIIQYIGIIFSFTFVHTEITEPRATQ